MREHNARDRSAGDCGAGRADVTPTADVTAHSDCTPACDLTTHSDGTPACDVTTHSDVTAHSDGTPAAGVVDRAGAFHAGTAYRAAYHTGVACHADADNDK